MSLPHRWHMQETGQGDTLLLLHGAGGSTHSYRSLMPLLARRHRVVAIDLPGQGFTQLGARHRSGLQSMSEDIALLCKQEALSPVAIIGHSAGGAVALELSQRLVSPRGQMPAVVGINAALGTFEGFAGVLFPVFAKLLAALPFSARMFSATSASPERIQALIGSTGSNLDAEGLDLYRRLVADRDHVDGTLLMMAQWDLTPLLETLHTIHTPCLLIAGDRDGTVPPSVSEAAARRLPEATVKHIEAGHLAQEEDPEMIAGIIEEFLRL
jgi:magnesium chelatase accessory protein